MKMLRAIAVAVLAATATLPAAAATLSSGDVVAPFGIDALLHATALDEVFSQFGPAIAEAPEQQGIPLPGDMAGRWGAAAAEVFLADDMHGELAAAMQDRLTGEEAAELGDFYASDFGRKISELERAMTMLDPQGQYAARDGGLAMMAALDPASPRGALVEELLSLVGAEITNAMMAESIRGMLIGMTLAGRGGGDIEVPWEEIDAQLQAMMPMLMADLVQTQQAIAHFAYQGLSDAELEQYVAFLRGETARKFYGLAAVAVGQIVKDRMTRFGETLAGRGGAVNT